SNLGMYGIDAFTAIINPPEAAILAVGTAVQQPVRRGGELVDRTIMTLTLTVDHRVLNGAVAATFLQKLRAILESPLRIVVWGARCSYRVPGGDEPVAIAFSSLRHRERFAGMLREAREHVLGH